jgi:hypothetical protein
LRFAAALRYAASIRGARAREAGRFLPEPVGAGAVPRAGCLAAARAARRSAPPGRRPPGRVHNATRASSPPASVAPCTPWRAKRDTPSANAADCRTMHATIGSPSPGAVSQASWPPANWDTRPRRRSPGLRRPDTISGTRRAKCCGCTEAFQASRAGSIPVARSLSSRPAPARVPAGPA